MHWMSRLQTITAKHNVEANYKYVDELNNYYECKVRT